MRPFLAATLLVVLLPMTTWGRSSRSSFKIRSMKCFIVEDAQVYAIKEAGRFETGKFRCQAELVGSGQSDRGPASLELRQAGKSFGKVSTTTFLAPTGRSRYEVEMDVPADYNACEAFELVMTLGQATGTFPVKVECED